MPEIDPQQKGNIPEFSVSSLSAALRRTIEEGYGRVRVRGELSKVKIHSSGHLYTALKDDQSLIDAVCWRGTLARLSVRPEEGLEVVCTGRITTYPARSSYQLVIESMEVAGRGALLKMLDDRRKKLAAEGLFDTGRKRPLPFLPRRIGVVTSPTGAVIRDILHRLRDRFPTHVLVWPVAVQGAAAADQIAAAIAGFDSMPDAARPDLVIVARGGGSFEDLMPFNEEAVVRAAALCRIPLISAVGHETDTTLIDYAADLRAPTPTAAAELAVPERLALLAQVMDDGQRLLGAAQRSLLVRRQRLETLSARLGDPARALEIRTQRLDHAGHRLRSAFEKTLARRTALLVSLAGKLVRPAQLVELKRKTLAFQTQNLARATARSLERQAVRIEQAGRLLESLSFERVLDRGYAVVRDVDGNPVTHAAALKPMQKVSLHLRDGRVGAKIEE